MMDIPIYSLSTEETNGSDQYYTDISNLTDEVLAEAATKISSIINAFRDYLKNEPAVLSHSELECIFELLLLGTLWENYGGGVYGLPGILGLIMTGLVELRSKVGWLKPQIDFWRGILGTKYVISDKCDNQIRHLPPALKNLERLLFWLRATGEYNQEIKRFKAWRDFLAAVPSSTAADCLTDVISFARWFQVRGGDVLGSYTSGVGRFLSEDYPRHYWREDVILCGKRQAEYHANMVGAEILNRAYRADFLQTKSKAVILPSCMRYRDELNCRAEQSNYMGLICAGCSAPCKVFHLTKLGREYGFAVYIISHASTLKNMDRLVVDEDTGIIGVSCVASLISGGFLAKSLRIPAQCILLDYCGCKHWCENKIATEININQLKEILQDCKRR